MASTIKLIVFAIASSLVYGGTLSEIINYSSDTSLGEVFALGAGAFGSLVLVVFTVSHCPLPSRRCNDRQ